MNWGQILNSELYLVNPSPGEIPRRKGLGMSIGLLVSMGKTVEGFWVQSSNLNMWKKIESNTQFWMMLLKPRIDTVF